jgi:hypothetical protein
MKKILLLCFVAMVVHAADVTVVRLPAGGLQPQVMVDAQGTVHVVYLTGEPAASDVMYVTRAAGSTQWSKPLSVNSQSKSAIAMGTVRGAHLALGREGRVHVAWLGSAKAQPRPADGSMPLLYARLDPGAMAFTPQRNLVGKASGLDGGGSIAADVSGQVHVAWHAMAGAKDEDGRRVFIATSTDDGTTFAPEQPAQDQPTGACGCCGLSIASAEGRVAILYRAADDNRQRDAILLTTSDRKRWTGIDLQPWPLDSCPMSTAALVPFDQGGWLAAWQTGPQVFWSEITAKGKKSREIAAPGEPKGRKHPALAVQRDGRVLFAWSEGTGWNKGGSIRWQVFDAKGKPLGEPGQADSLLAWSLPAVAVWGDGFALIY